MINPYDPDAVVQLRHILDDIRYQPDDRRGYYFDLNTFSPGISLNLVVYRPDILTGVYEHAVAGRVFITQPMSEADIVRQAFGLIKNFQEHEVREEFTYKGARVFGPHITAGALIDAAQHVDYEESNA